MKNENPFSTKSIMLLATILSWTILAAPGVGTLRADPGAATGVKGRVEMIAPGETKPVRLRNGDQVPAGATIITKRGGEAVVPLTTGSAVRISGGSNVQIQESRDGSGAAPPKARIQLRSGTAAALIREKAKMDFQIETPHGIAAARGTFYAVSVKGGKTFAAVREGKIDVSSKTKD